MRHGRAGRRRPRTEAKPAELRKPGTGAGVGLQEIPAGLSAFCKQERYPDDVPRGAVGTHGRERRRSG